MKFVDRYGNTLPAETGEKQFTIFTSTGKLTWRKKGDVVSYLIDITLSNSSGGRYEFADYIPFKHLHTYGTLSAWVGSNDVRQYGDFQITPDGSLIMDLPKYSSALTVRGSCTAVILD